MHFLLNAFLYQLRYEKNMTDTHFFPQYYRNGVVPTGFQGKANHPGAGIYTAQGGYHGTAGHGHGSAHIHGGLGAAHAYDTEIITLPPKNMTKVVTKVLVVLTLKHL